MIRGEDFSICFPLFPLCCSDAGLSEAPPHSEGSSTSGERQPRRTAPAPPADQRGPASRCAPSLPLPPPAFVRRGKPATSSLMHPFQWCNGESGGERALGSPGTGEGAQDLRSEAFFFFSVSRAKFLLKWGGREGVREPQLYSARRGNGKTHKQTHAKPRLHWAGGEGSPEGRRRGSRGVRGPCVAAASLSFPLLPCLCALQLGPLLRLSEEPETRARARIS